MGARTRLRIESCVRDIMTAFPLYTEHPWVHPGASTSIPNPYESDRSVFQAISGFNEKASEEQPLTDSGYVRSSRKVLLGQSILEPHEKLSTTHLAYLQGRTAPFQGLVVEVAPRWDGNPLGVSGFCKVCAFTRSFLGKRKRAPACSLCFGHLFSSHLILKELGTIIFFRRRSMLAQLELADETTD